MIGELIERIRKDRKMTKTELALRTNINVGHIAHIEKGERNPSHKALQLISEVLDVPYYVLLHIYDIEKTQDMISSSAVNHIRYDSVPVFKNFLGFTECTGDMRNASFVYVIKDGAMAPKYNVDDKVFVEYQVPLNNKDIGIILYDNEIIIRKFIVRKTDIVLRAQNSFIPDIVINRNTKFHVIGKIIGKVEQ